MTKEIMLKYKPNYLILWLVAFLTACGSNTDLPIQHADEYDYITFSAQTEKVNTKANAYEAYNPNSHPNQMAVFGYHDIDLGDNSKTIYDNAIITYQNTKGVWTDSSDKRWDDYSGAKTFDFFGYMPPATEATLKNTGNTTNSAGVITASNYTLTIPFSMPKDQAFLQDVKQAPIICAQPIHKEGTTAEGNQFTFERVVKFQFDQTLTAYRLLFSLDSKMGAVRQFRIKQVAISGDIATSGSIKRYYTWRNNVWTAQNIVWLDIQRTTFTEENPMIIPISQSASTGANSDSGSSSLIVSTNGYTQWGDAFYTIPDADFQPTIHVTYDVEFVDQDGKTVVTRKDVTSTILLNNTNFKNYTTGSIATLYPIRILIQPRYLYVLSDEDAYTGYLLIE